MIQINGIKKPLIEQEILAEALAISVYTFSYLNYQITPIIFSELQNHDSSLVILVTKANQIFAYVHENVGNELRNKNVDLKLDGKKITKVNVLDDENFIEFITLVGKINNVTSLQPKSQNPTDKSYVQGTQEAVLSDNDNRSTNQHFVLATKFANSQHKDVMNMLRKWQDNINEVNRHLKDADRRERVAHFDILKKEINRQELRFQTNKAEASA